jgi:hypothetical protein
MASGLQLVSKTKELAHFDAVGQFQYFGVGTP